MLLRKPRYSQMTDEAIMKAISSGDKKAFDELYTRYSGALLRYFHGKLWKDQEKAEDFVHDLFAKIVRNPESFDPSRSFKTWVYSVANNMCKNEYKKQEVRKGMQNGLDASYAVHDESSNVLRDVHEIQFRDKFERCLEDLDIKHKEAFCLRHIEGLSIKEIAEILELSDGTVKSRIFYATKYLAEGLREFNPTINR